MDLDFAHYLQFFFALVFVIGLIGLVTLVMRHYGLGGAIKLNARSRDGRRRIAIVDAVSVDARRRLILIRRDDVEHLVLLGAHDDILIEGGIIPPKSGKRWAKNCDSGQNSLDRTRPFSVPEQPFS
mgnify:CR=1 FL=1